MNGWNLGRLLAWALIASFLIWCAGIPMDEVIFVAPDRVRLAPESEECISHPAPSELDFGGPRVLYFIGRWAAGEGGDDVERLRAICTEIRGMMPGPPRFPQAQSRRIRRRQMSLQNVVDSWERGEEVDSLSLANLTLQVATTAGLACRLVVMDDARIWQPRGFAAVEVYNRRQNGWMLLEPAMGVLFNTPNGYLSALEVRERIASALAVDVTPIGGEIPGSELGPPALEYAPFLTNVWMPLRRQAADVMERPFTWGLLKDGLARPGPWRVRALAGKLNGRLKTWWKRPRHLSSKLVVALFAVLAIWTTASRLVSRRASGQPA